MALIASNLITIIAYMYRLIWKQRDVEDEIAQGPPRIYISRSSFAITEQVPPLTIDLANMSSHQEAVEDSQDEEFGQYHARQDSTKSFESISDAMTAERGPMPGDTILCSKD